MRRNLIGLLFVFFCFLLQSTVFQSLTFAGIVPNLLMILTSSYGFMRGEKEGMVFGFICGMLCDVFFAGVLGMYALVYMYIGFVNGKFARIIYPDDIKLPLVLITVSDLAYGMFCYVFLFLLRGRFHFAFYLLHVIVPEAVYTLLIALLLYPLLLWVHNRLEKKEKGSVRDLV